MSCTYFNSTVAPAAANCAFIFSASSLEAPSLTVFPPASTKSLASFSPNPVIVLTSLITAVFLSPNPVKITSKSDFSSTAAAPAPAAATATG